ncbi:hypothetical protein ABIE63_000183 [Limibacillus sp. MBR-115]|jgi:hypothetical protein
MTAPRNDRQKLKSTLAQTEPHMTAPTAGIGVVFFVFALIRFRMTLASAK